MTAVSIGRNEGIVGDKVRFRNFIKQLMGNTGLQFFGICSNDGIVGEDIRIRDGIKNLPGIGKLTTFGVEENEVVGEVG